MGRPAEAVVWEFRNIWRAAGMGVAGGVALYCLARLLVAKQGESLLGVGGLALAAILVGVQLFTWRNVLTPSHVVRRRGLLGRRHIATPLQAIQRVYFSYLPWNEAWRVGEIEIVTEDDVIRMFSIVNAESGVQRILTVKASIATSEAR